MNSFVTVTVYDLLAREVATLMNEEKPSDSYEVRFDATHLSSGICFYQLRAGSFRAIKEMLWMK